MKLNISYVRENIYPDSIFILYVSQVKYSAVYETAILEYSF